MPGQYYATGSWCWNRRVRDAARQDPACHRLMGVPEALPTPRRFGPRPLPTGSGLIEHVVIANPKQVRLIAHAKIETDSIDAAVLAEFYATFFLPEICTADGESRIPVLRDTPVATNPAAHAAEDIIQTILHTHLVSPCPHVNIIGISGKRWLRQQVVCEDVDQRGGNLKLVERDCSARYRRPNIKRLMVLP